MASSHYFLLPRANNNRKYILFASLVYVIGVFLVKAVNPPLGDLWKFLYLNVPVMRLFREVYHFMFLPAFALSILLGVGAGTLLSKMKRKYIKIVSIILFSLLILISSYPLLSGNFLKQVQTYQFDDDYRELTSYLTQTRGEFRVLYLPLLNPILYNNATYSGVDPMIKYSPIPTLYPTIDITKRFSRFTNFIVLSLRENKTNDITKLLSPIAVKLIVSRPNEYSWYYKYVPITRYQKAQFWNNNTYLIEVLSKQNNIHLTKTIGDNIYIYYLNTKTTNNHSYFHTTNNITLIIGDWKNPPKNSNKKQPRSNVH